MAKLGALPARHVISQYKGKLDFYVWKGIPCVRRWPRTTWASQTDASKASALEFGQLAKAITATAPEVQAAARDMAAGSPQTWKDLYISILYGGIFDD